MTTETLIETIIKFDISKLEFKKAIKAHKKFSLIGKGADQTSLGCINFKITEEKLILTSTDGIGALISEIEMINNFGEAGEFMLSTELLSKLTFPKGKQDILRISANETNAEFVDVEFLISQMLAVKKNIPFPDLESVKPKNNSFNVKISLSQIKDISQMYSKTGLVNFHFNTKDNFQNILITTDETDFNQIAIIAPWQDKEKDFS